MEDQLQQLAEGQQRLADRLDAMDRAGAAASAQCTADNPHPGQLSWDGKGYRCRCAKRYRKDGQGGLMEVD